MKKFIIIITCLVSLTSLYGQFVNHGITDENAGQLRRRTLVFVYRSADANRLEEIEEAIKYGWQYSDVILVPQNIYDTLRDDENDYSFMTINVKKKGGQVYPTLDLWYRFNEKKELLTSINLYVDRQTEYALESSSFPADELYDGGKIYDWQPGFLKIYIKIINDLINRREVPKGKIYYDKSYLNTFWSKTLIVSDISLMLKNESIDIERGKAIYENYPYNFKIKTLSEINDMLLMPPRPFFYSYYCKNGRNYYYCMISSTGKLVYSHKTRSPYLRVKEFDKFVEILMR